MAESLTLTDVPGVLVGHAESLGTGCTAVLCPEGFTPGAHVPGFAPGTRDLDLMRAENSVTEIHGLYLGGGSAFGLAGADGVVRFLREQGAGLAMPHARIPLVPGAIIYDLDHNQRPGELPDAALGYAAARAAHAGPVRRGRAGAARGARCGRLFTLLPHSDTERGGTEADGTSPGGLGSRGVRVGDVVVAALVVVNSLGAVHDPDTGQWLAGGVDARGRRLPEETVWRLLRGAAPRGNTTLAVVATNARLDKTGANRVARMASVGLGRAIRPAHLSFDGDVVFALARRDGPAASEDLVGALAAEALGGAVADAVLQAADDRPRD